MEGAQHHTLEFLLAFGGQVQWLAQGYRLKFKIKRVAAMAERPHGLRYSFTLHDPSGKRLVSFDNAHVVAAKGSRFTKWSAEADHWRRTDDDEGRPYRFVDADTLLTDFFREVPRVLAERGIGDDVMRTETGSET